MSRPEDSPPSGGKKEWATAKQWAEHRNIIAKLYDDDCNTLDEVINFMELEHNFFATPRMYKARLKQWGVTKNTRRQQKPSQAPSPASSASSTTTKQQTSPQQLKLSQTSPAESQIPHAPPSVLDALKDITLPSSSSSYHSPPPSTFPPTSATTTGSSPSSSYTYPPHVLVALRALNRFIATRPPHLLTLSSSTITSLEDCDWITEANTAALLIRSQQHRKGFLLLQSVFSRLRFLLTPPQPPALLHQIYMIAHTFLSAREEIWREFMRYALGMTEIVIGEADKEQDPLYDCLRLLYRMGPRDFSLEADTFHRAVLYALDEHIEGWGAQHHVSLLVTLRRAYLTNFLDPKELEECGEEGAGAGAGAGAGGGIMFQGQKRPFVGDGNMRLPLPYPVGEISMSDVEKKTDRLLGFRRARLLIKEREPGLKYFGFKMLGEVRLEDIGYVEL